MKIPPTICVACESGDCFSHQSETKSASVLNNVSGRPWFHGSTQRFDSFKTVTKAGVSHEEAEQPIFLSNDISFAKLHAGLRGWVYECRVTVSNTFDGDDLVNWSERYHFDYRTFPPLGKRVWDAIADNEIWPDGSDDPDGYFEALAKLNWDATQSPDFCRWLKANGYDSFLEMGEGAVNLGVFDESKIEILKVMPVDEVKTARKRAAIGKGQQELEDHQESSPNERLMEFDADTEERLYDIEGDPTTVDRSAQFQFERPVVQIHTHPDHTSHSDQDWKTFAWAHVKESRVIAKDHIYILRKTPEWDKRPWQEHTPAKVYRRWNEILDEHTDTSKDWEVDTVLNGVNAQMAKEFGAEFIVLPRFRKRGASDAVQNVLNALSENFEPDPQNPKQRVVNIGGITVGDFELDEREGRLRIRSIQSRQPYQGVGSFILRRILKAADRESVTVELTASPKGHQALDGDKLKQWYGRYGFVEEPGYDPALGYMIREPQRKTAAIKLLSQCEEIPLPVNKTATLNPLSQSDIKRISREQAIQMMREQNQQGKNQGQDNLDDFSYLQPGPYIQTRIPLADLDFIHQDAEREKRYAEMPGDFPPVLGRFGWRSIKNHLEGDPLAIHVTNGNHRASAAALRGDPDIMVVMPEKDYDLYYKAKADLKQALADYRNGHEAKLGTLKIHVTHEEAQDFLAAPPSGHEEFWAFRQHPKVAAGDILLFHCGGQSLASAVVSRVEQPGKHACERTGRFRDRYKVYWSPESFKKLGAEESRSNAVIEESSHIDENGFRRWRLNLKVDGDKAGSMELIEHPEGSVGVDEGDAHLKVDWVFVEPEYRRKGYAAQLYRKAKELALAHGFPELRSAYSVSPAASAVWNSVGGEQFDDHGVKRWRMKVAKWERTVSMEPGDHDVKIGDATMQYKVVPDRNLVDFYQIKVPPRARQQGQAKAAMTALIEAADEVGYSITLIAVPQDKKTDMEGLVRLYESLGFVQTKVESEDNRPTLRFMERSPKKASQSVVNNPPPPITWIMPEPGRWNPDILRVNYISLADIRSSQRYRNRKIVAEYVDHILAGKPLDCMMVTRVADHHYDFHGFGGNHRLSAMKKLGYTNEIVPVHEEAPIGGWVDEPNPPPAGLKTAAGKDGAKIGSWQPNEAQLDTLKDIDSRVGDDFTEWLEDLIGLDGEPTLTEQDRLDYLTDYLEEKHGIGVEEHGYCTFYHLTPAVEQLIGDLPVVVYHHTSTAILPKVKREGLRADVKRINTHDNSGSGVYVTTELSGPAVEGYHAHALKGHGRRGREVTLSIKTYLADLIQDPDDADLSSGAHQFILPYVAPGDILWDEPKTKIKRPGNEKVLQNGGTSVLKPGLSYGDPISVGQIRGGDELEGDDFGGTVQSVTGKGDQAIYVIEEKPGEWVQKTGLELRSGRTLVRRGDTIHVVKQLGKQAALTVSWDKVREHIDNTNPHLPDSPRNAWGSASRTLPTLEWQEETIAPDDSRLDLDNLHPASKSDVARYIKHYRQWKDYPQYEGFPRIVLVLADDKFQVIDGAHRLAAMVKLGIPIPAFVGKGKNGGKPEGGVSAKKQAATLPTKSFKQLWHVGTMDISKKRTGSHEGTGLSVSTEPKAWQRIHRIGGTVWLLTKPGNKFLDAHRITPKQRQAIDSWGLDEGWIEQATLYRVPVLDESGDEDETYMEFETREEAEAELESDEDVVTEVSSGRKASPAMIARLGETAVPSVMVEDLLLTFYAEDVLKLDGVCSASRGVIFNSMVSSWKATEVKQAAQQPDLKQQIESLRPDLIAVARKLYDEWGDPQSTYLQGYRKGEGICDFIATQMAVVLIENGISAVCHTVAKHSVAKAYNDTECFAVDLPHDLYETKAPFGRWRRIPDVNLSEADIVIVRAGFPTVEEVNRWNRLAGGVPRYIMPTPSREATEVTAPSTTVPGDQDGGLVKSVTMASTSITASPEIARFEGMTFHVFGKDHDPPHVDVRVNDKKYRFSLFDGKNFGKPTAPASVATRVQKWLATAVPGTKRTVMDLVYDQWLKIRNSQPTGHVPTPDEIKVMGRPKKNPTLKKNSSSENYYAIDQIEVLPDSHLKVWFVNGDVKIVNVKAMRGDNPMFNTVWKDFEAAKNYTCFVAWPVEFPSGPNIIEIEDQDIWGAGVDVSAFERDKQAALESSYEDDSARFADQHDPYETDPGDVWDRVVWKRQSVIPTTKLDRVGLATSGDEFPSLRAVHVGDPDFWFGRLVADYDRAPRAWVIEIKTVEGDVVVDDVQNAIPDQSGQKGDSMILVTRRTELREGVDFTYTKTLGKKDLPKQDSYAAP